jgi:Domain of unknown function (DUF5063)
MKIGYSEDEAARIAIAEFLPFAQRYFDWLERAADRPTGNSELRDLHVLLAELQAAATRLPLNPGGDEHVVSEEPNCGEAATKVKASWDLAKRVAGLLPANAYSVVFDALDDSDRTAIMTTLEDDLGDIHSDLKNGMRALEAGTPREALWEWWFSYWNHWGRHAVHAQTAIWAHLAAGNYFD